MSEELGAGAEEAAVTREGLGAERIGCGGHGVVVVLVCCFCVLNKKDENN